MRIYLSTGDTSAEPHALGFIKACKKMNSECSFSAMGGDILRDAGVEIAFDSTEIKVMGFVAIVRHLPKIYHIFREVLNYISKDRPDAVVLVDYPGFHLRLARKIKERFPDIPIVYYITPQVWAWHTSRVEIIKKYVDWSMCILPFEQKWFLAHGVAAEYVGSPVYDGIKGTDRNALRKRLAIADDLRIISIFAGSRAKEIEYILKPMLDAVELLRGKTDRLVFVLSVASGMRKKLQTIASDMPDDIFLIEGSSHEVLASSDFVFAKSGTTTLEAALLNIPMLVAYRGDVVSAKLAFYLKKKNNIPYISLPNIIMGKEIVPEFLQDDCSGGKMADFAAKVLNNREVSDKIKSDYEKLRNLVGNKDSAVWSAESFFNFLNRKNKKK